MFTNIFKSHLPSILGTIILIKFHFKQKEERKENSIQVFWKTFFKFFTFLPNKYHIAGTFISADRRNIFSDSQSRRYITVYYSSNILAYVLKNIFFYFSGRCYVGTALKISHFTMRYSSTIYNNS
jgi:hypothetical protein